MEEGDDVKREGTMGNGGGEVALKDVRLVTEVGRLVAI